ncbi:MAG TPA: ABC transporter substrate-binding protein [Paralcaligenes sp.]
MIVKSKVSENTSRRLFLRGAVGLSIGGLVIPSWGFAQAKNAGTATYGVASIDPSYALIYVALKKGYFTDAGVKVEYLNSQSGPRTKQMVAAGQLLMGTSGVSDAIALTIAGKQCVLVGCLDTRVAYANILINKKLHDKGIKDVKQLDGLSIGVTQPQAGTWLMATYIIDRAGLKGKVTIKPLGDYATMMGAVKSGAVDCTMATFGMLEKGQEEGWGATLFDTTNAETWNAIFGGDVPGYGCYVMQEQIEKRPDTVQAMMTGLSKASDFLKQASPAEIADTVYADYLKGFSMQSVVSAITVYKKSWSYDNLITEANYARLISIMSGRQYSKEDLAKAPYEKNVNMSFLQKARNKA